MLFSTSRVIYVHAERHRTPAGEDKAMTTKAKRENKKTGKTEFRFWQDGTGYLTIQLH